MDGLRARMSVGEGTAAVARPPGARGKVTRSGHDFSEQLTQSGGVTAELEKVCWVDPTNRGRPLSGAHLSSF